ncbi:CHAT domain-containing tetratricopeptide repeat protein [uncultured Tenacibaculum sp.]|uniref:CHAT domain-containing protein n=1 Tax=uncultured Tenacibaculum sp. TaxID=174713 RepID=UPI002605668F|nr:CHAT domain-containing tetratricopeptide repeat protein [uncultured Tenacibaculum sp.]
MNRFLFLFLSFLIIHQKSFSQSKLNQEKEIDSIYKLNIENTLKTQILEEFITKRENLTKENISYAYHKQGILYSFENNYEKAISVTQKSINIRIDTDSINYYKLNNSFYNLNYYYKVQGNEKKQKEIIIKLQSQPVKNKFTYKSYIDLGFIFTNKGDYFNALINFNKVIENYTSYKDPRTLLKAHEAVIATYSYIDETKRYLEEINYHINSIDNILKNHNYLSTDIGYKNNLANIYENLNKPFKVIELYKQVLKVYEEKNDFGNVGRVYSNIGRVYNKLKKRKKANYFFDKALEIKTDKKAIAAVNSNMGDYLTPEIKIRYNKKAIGILLDRGYDETVLSLKEITNSDYTLDILDYLIENVEASIKNYESTLKNDDLNKAIEISILVDKLISFIRLESIVDTSKLFWIRKAASFYMKAVTLSYYKNDVSQAFYFMEKNKALLLLEGLNNTKGSNKKESLIISLEESIRQHIGKEKNLVEYILNEKRGFGIFCNENEKIFYKLENVPELINQVDSLKNKMSKYFIYKDDKEKYKRLANNVFLKLFPFKNSIKKIKNKGLIVIPDYKLQRINFEALIPDALTGEYLLEHTEINYLLSASVFEKLNRNTKKSIDKILAFAPVNFNQKTLQSLKRSKKAMQEVASICETELFIEEEATKETFIKELKNYSIIHLNNHAGLNKIDNDPWIAFRDKKINLKELLSLSNNAELVVLDACNGASGKQEIGEGIMSLSRGFFRGGAKSVITTQWKANEKSTNEILKVFYKELSAGKTKLKALNIAKKNYLKTHQLSETSPYFWASLILIGNPDSIKIIPSTNYSNWVWILLFITLGVIFLFLKRNKLFLK